MDLLARFVIRHRRLVGLALVVVTAAFVPGIAQVSFEEDPQAFFRCDGPDQRLWEQLADDFGSDANDVIIVVQGDDLFDTRSIQAVRDIAFRSAKLDGVDYALSLASIKRSGSLVVPLLPYVNLSPERREAARREALDHPLVAGHFLSADAQTTLIMVRISGVVLELHEAERIVTQLRAICEESLRDTDLEARLSGIPTICVESFANAKRECVWIGAVSVLISTLIAMLLFRRLTSTAIAVAGPMCGVLWTLGVMGYTGRSISGVTTILPTLLFVIGFSDSIHLIMEARRSLGEGNSPRAAAARAIRKVGVACALTSLTTAVGFGSMMLAETDGIQQFGMNCTYGAILTFCSVITVVPLLLSTQLAQRVGGSPASAWPAPARKWAGWPFALTLKYPRLVSSVGILTTVLLAIAAFQLKPDIAMTEGIPRDSETRQVVGECDEAFGGSLYASVILQWPERLQLGSRENLALTREVHETLDDEPVAANSISILNLLESMPGSGDDLSARVPDLRRVPPEMLGRFVRPDRRKLLVTFRVPDAGGVALKPVFERLDNRFRELEDKHPDFRISLTGSPVVSARNVMTVITDLAKSLTLASVFIFLIITFTLRSARLGLISIIPNVFPLVLAAGVLVLNGQSLRLGSAIAFTLGLGLAVDDTIHFLVRFRQQRQIGRSVRRAARDAYFQVGVAIVITSLVVTGGFASMFISEVPSILIFAQISCIAILAALAGDLIVLPALLLWLNKRSKRTLSAAARQEGREIEKRQFLHIDER